MKCLEKNIENITIVKIIVYLSIGVMCLAELLLWRFGEVPPRPDEDPAWLNLLFSFTAPSFAVVYAVLSFWAIFTYLEELEVAETDVLEGIFAMFGFCLFMIITLIIPFHTQENQKGNVVFVVINMILAVFLLITSIALFVCWQSYGSLEEFPSYVDETKVPEEHVDEENKRSRRSL